MYVTLEIKEALAGLICGIQNPKVLPEREGKGANFLWSGFPQARSNRDPARPAIGNDHNRISPDSN
jgi:hypothetical protein